jgi:hypothetical protein
MSVPKNLIKVKTASRGELVYKATNAPFSGSYYELDSKIYEGDSFRYGAFELVTPQNSNKLFNNNATFAYSLFTGITSQTLSQPEINQIPNNPISHNSSPVSFYYTQINIQPAFIREVDEQTYLSLQGNPLYKTTYVGTYKGIYQSPEEANKQVPGVQLLIEASSGDTRNNTL